jgi:hypothetical protein
VEGNLTEKQKNLLGCPMKIPSKRKATKGSSGSRPKKAPKITYGTRKPRRQRKIVLNESGDDQEKAEREREATLAEVAAFEAKEKEKKKGIRK